MEQALGDLPVPVTFLRPAWFIENYAWDVASARDTGRIASFLQPLDRPIAMISAAEVGRVAADLLQEDWQGRRVVELEAAHRIAPLDVGAALDAGFGDDEPIGRHQPRRHRDFAGQDPAGNGAGRSPDDIPTRVAHPHPGPAARPWEAIRPV